MRRIPAIVLLLLFSLTGCSAVAPNEVVVEDTAGVLHADTLLPALEDIGFHKPTKVVIYTYNGPEDSYSGTVLNSEVLRYALEEHPEWVSGDRQKWADGVFIFALDPVGRWTGTYFGEDRKVPMEQQEQIREEANDLFREAQWTDGTITAVEEAAKLINRPWYYPSPKVLLLAAGAVFFLFGTKIFQELARLQRQRKNRKLRAEADASYSSVTHDLDATEVNANTIPADSLYGARILEEYRTFMTRYNEATRLSNAAQALSAKDLKERTSTATLEKYLEATMDLDSLDDVIADTNALLNKAPGWERAWDRQADPLYDDLDRLDKQLEGRNAGDKDAATAQALRSFRQQTREQLATAATDLAADRITADQALDRIKDGRTELSALLKDHAQTVIAALTKSRAEAAIMKDELNRAAEPGRRRREGYSTGITDTAFPYIFYSVRSFGSGIKSGTSRVDTVRNPSSSSGSSSGSSSRSTGYGSSGGSFSGSGSSGRF